MLFLRSILTKYLILRLKIFTYTYIHMRLLFPLVFFYLVLYLSPIKPTIMTYIELKKEEI